MKRLQIVSVMVLALAGCPEEDPQPLGTADAPPAATVDAPSVSTPDAPAVVVPDAPPAASSPDAPPASTPDAPPVASCDPTPVLGRVWELSSSGSFFYLLLRADGTYRRETDVPPSTVICEHGTWSTTECGTIEFHTCRGDVEARVWSASGTRFTLDQTNYRESSFDEDLAFSFCAIDECD